MSEAEKALQDYVALINAAPDPAANIHRPADPTPDQLLEWMKEQLELYADCRASGNWNNLPLHFIPRIIDTVKRVTG